MRYVTYRGSDADGAEGHVAPITSVAWDESGSRLATGSYDGSAIVWRLGRARRGNGGGPGSRLERQAIVRHARLVNGVAFSPTGDLLATASADHTIRLTDPDAAEPKAWLARHTDDVNRTAWSPDGRMLVSVSQDTTGRIWDAKAGLLTAIVVVHGGHALGVDWNRRTGTIASCGEDSTLRLWSAEEAAREIELSGDAEDVKWSRGATRAALACDDGYAYVVDPDGATLLRLGPARAAVKSVAWSPDDAQLACGAYDGTVVVWDVAAQRPLLELSGPRLWPRSLAWSTEGVLAVGTLDSHPLLVDVEAELGRGTNGARKLQPRPPGRPTIGINSIAEIPGFGVALAVDDGTVRAAALDDRGRFGDVETVVGPAGARSLVNAVAVSTEGRIAYGTFDGTVGVTAGQGSAPTEILLATPINSLAWLDPTTVVAALYDGRLAVLAAAADAIEVARFIPAHPGPIKSCAAFGEHVVAGATDNTISVHTVDGGCLRRFEGHARIVNDVALALDASDLIASASQDHTVRLWSISSGRCLDVLVGHDESVKSVALAAGGRPDVLSGSYDFDARVWRLDPEAGAYACIQQLDAHGNGVGSVAWWGGKVPVTASWDGSCIAWETPDPSEPRGRVASRVALGAPR